MCVRFIGYGAEELTKTSAFLSHSSEFFTLENQKTFISYSQETPDLLKAFLSDGYERFVSPEEEVLQSPETGTAYVPPDPNTDIPVETYPAPGGWPLRHRDLSVSSTAYWIPEPSLRVYVAGVELTSYLISFSVSESRGQPCGGSIVCRDRDGFIAGELSSLNLSNTDILAHKRDFSRTVEISFSQRGVSTLYPTFIPLDPQWDENGVVTINFTDGNALLDLDDQTLDDIVADEGFPGTANDTLQRLGALAGVNVVPSVRDFAIKTFRFKNQNVDYGLNTIMQVTQGYKIFRGRVCHIESLKEKTPVFKFKDRIHIENLSGGFDTNGLRTYFRALMTEQQPSFLAAPKTCIGGDCVGRVINLTFDFPSVYAHVFWSGEYGDVVDGVFFDEQDRPVGSGFTYAGNQQYKAARWEATFRPLFSSNAGNNYALAYTPEWTVWAIGGSPPSGLSREEFIANLAAASAEAKFGRRPEYSPMTSELISSKADLTAMLQAVVKEVEWSIKKFSMTTPYVNRIRAGDFVHVEDYWLNLNDNLLVLGWSHDWDTQNGFSASYDLAGKI